LSKDNADGTARHLVAAGLQMEADDLDAALEHALAASRRAGRVAGVRETLGVVYYRRGEWAKALGEFRTARRISGLSHLLPMMADTERGLGRPERALQMAATPEAKRLSPAEQIEMAIVVSGARTDMGQTAAAVQHLRDLAGAGSGREPWAARLRYAYAAALDADGRNEEAQAWYERAAEVDLEGETDVLELLGVEEDPQVIDLTPDEDDPALDAGNPDDRAGQGGEDQDPDPRADGGPRR
jgi:tetratricopeptide (TPR) repeat protein